MRTVYLTRDKSFVGCLGKLNVYVEDSNASEITIAGIPCRFVCKVKNGETVSFQIGDDAVKVVVIADKLSKDMCNDYYQIPAGAGDVEIGGKCSYNPGAGNPFRFHGVTDEEALANRKRSNKKGIITTVIAVIVGMIIGFAMNMDVLFEKPKQFTSDAFEITLTTAFSDKYEDGIHYFGSREVSVAIYTYNFNEYAQITSMSEQEFLNLLKDSGHFDISSQMKTESGLLIVEEKAESNQGDIRSYLTVFIKDDEAFYLVEFGCETEKYQENRAQFLEWAKSFKIK